MTMNLVGPVPHPRFPLSGVTPFTYRDGWTYLEVLENFRRWIRDELVPIVNDNAEKMEAAYEAALLTFLEAVNDFNEYQANLTQEFNEFKSDTAQQVSDIRAAAQTVADIFDELQANGPVVSVDGSHGIVNLEPLIRNYTRTGALPVGRGELIVNVKDHGATGDGTTNDTQAFNDALAELAGTGGTIFVPPGTFVIDGIDLPNDTSLKGAGPWASQIKAATVGSTVVQLGTRSTIHSLRILGTRTADTGSVGVVTDGANRWAMYDTHISGHQVGVHFANTWIGSFFGCLGQGNDIAFLFDGPDVHAITVFGGELQSNRTAVELRYSASASNNISFIGATIEGNSEYGIYVSGATPYALTVRDCYFESNETGHIYTVPRTRSLTITGSTFSGRYPFAIKVESAFDLHIYDNTFSAAAEMQADADSIICGSSVLRAVIGPNWYGQYQQFDPAEHYAGVGLMHYGPITTQLRPSTTEGASLNIPVGTFPTAPKQGDIWSNASGLFIHLDGQTHRIGTAPL